MPAHYCGSCYGAAPDPSQCCNTCDDIRAAYRQRRWGFPDENTFEQCRRDTRMFQFRNVKFGGEGRFMHAGSPSVRAWVRSDIWWCKVYSINR